MKLMLRISGEVTDIVLAERDDKNYSQLEKDGRLPYMKFLDGVPFGYAEMLDDKKLCCLWSDGTCIDTEAVDE